MGSGQHTIMEGYAAAKLVKAGWRSNNLDPNARHCMASAVAGFMQTFGIDEPAGCYDDIELTDSVVLWGANMAEMHPMLWARIVDVRQKHPAYRIVNLTTYGERVLGPRRRRDRLPAQHRPRDLELPRPGDRDARRGGPGVRRDSLRVRGGLDRHRLRDAPGRSLRAPGGAADTRARQRSVVLTKEDAALLGGKAGDAVAQSHAEQAAAHWLMSFDEYRRALEPYTLEAVAPLARGDPDEPLEAFAAKLAASRTSTATGPARSSRTGPWGSTSTPAAPG